MKRFQFVIKFVSDKLWKTSHLFNELQQNISASMAKVCNSRSCLPHIKLPLSVEFSAAFLKIKYSEVH